LRFLDLTDFASFSQGLLDFNAAPAYRIEALERTVRRLEADVRALQASHETAAAAQSRVNSRLQSGVTLKGWTAPRLNSVTVSDFSQIFDEFRGKRFSLLLRGGRGGLGSPAFHADGPILTCSTPATSEMTVFWINSPTDLPDQG
jgi:hypothetical protein